MIYLRRRPRVSPVLMTAWCWHQRAGAWPCGSQSRAQRGGRSHPPILQLDAPGLRAPQVWCLPPAPESAAWGPASLEPFGGPWAHSSAAPGWQGGAAGCPEAPAVAGGVVAVHSWVLTSLGGSPICWGLLCHLESGPGCCLRCRERGAG